MRRERALVRNRMQSKKKPFTRDPIEVIHLPPGKAFLSVRIVDAQGTQA